jgi:hypothetical protein
MVKKFYFLIALILLSTFALTFAQVEEDVDVSMLANPALVNIDQMYVAVTPFYDTRVYDERRWEALDSKLEAELLAKGIRVAEDFAPLVDMRGVRTAGIVVLIDQFRFSDTDRFMYRVKTMVRVGLYYSPVRAKRQVVETEVWSRCGMVVPSSEEFANDAIMRLAMGHLAEFLPEYEKVREISEPVITEPEPVIEKKETSRRTRQPVRQRRSKTISDPNAVLDIRYVASKKSKVFHRSDCPAVKRISEDNLIEYETRIEAMRDNRRPCKLCKP